MKSRDSTMLGGLFDDLPKPPLKSLTENYLSRLLNVAGPRHTLITVALFDESLNYLSVFKYSSRGTIIKESIPYLKGEPIPRRKALMWKVVEVEEDRDQLPEWMHQDYGYYIVRDVPTARNSGYFLPAMEDTKSVFLSPIKLQWSEERMIGVLAVDSNEQDGFNPSDNLTEFFHMSSYLFGSMFEGFYRMYHDPVLDLALKIYHRAYLYKYLKNNSDESHSIWLVYLDLNEFRKINATFGHIGGDMVIDFFAEKINSSCTVYRKKTGLSTVCFRYGGDEFAVAVLCTKPEDNIKKLLMYLNEEVGRDLKEIENSLNTSLEKPATLSLSFAAGIANSHDLGSLKTEEDIDKFIQKADETMNFAKDKRKSDGRIESVMKYSTELEVIYL